MLFPEGISLEKNEFRTTAISPFLVLIEDYDKAKSSLAGEGGFEPPPYGPEPHVLPLDYSPWRTLL